MAGTGLIFLLPLTVVMTLASFLAGALPLSMTLSQSQLRLIASIGIGILVGTSLIVIIPEGIEAVAEASIATHHPHLRSLHSPRDGGTAWWKEESLDLQAEPAWSANSEKELSLDTLVVSASNNAAAAALEARNPADEPESPKQASSPSAETPPAGSGMPTFYIGLSLVLGFILMFLVDRLPRHASENFQPPPPRHISLSNLGGSSLSAGEEESEGFLGSLTPTPKQSRSLATTTGLVIHAAADGIAMGASVSSADKKLGLIVFIAIMVHKAPAAFGLTSVLLKQGLSKRAARGHLIVFSLASPFGAWVTFILVSFLGGGAQGEVSQWWTGMLLLFSAGTFLYVAMHTMQEGESASHDIGSGTVYAWVLSRAIPESNITAICRSNYEVASQGGFIINSTTWGAGLHVRPQIVRSVSEAVAQSQSQSQPFDYILVTSKALPTKPSTAELIQPAITPGKTAVVLVQNGIGIEEEYARLYAGDDVPILSASIYLPATQTAPGVVRHQEIEHLHIGTYPASGVPDAHKRAARVFVDLLATAGATATLHDDIQTKRWGKLLINGSWNPICALTRLRDKQFLEIGGKSGTREENEKNAVVQFVRDVMLEIASVAQACGQKDIDEKLVDFQLGYAISRTLPGIQPSMMDDALAMKNMEVDAIIGNVVKMAREKNIPVPMLRTVYLLAQGLNTSFSLAK
ncbi:hypothetical protein NUW58_g7662 [Xylaria curta]|uniref:Uncharacterized protein n=1 Tax=Xylaria curta TaxID=42375 RepID=A0ACC1NFW1_9PEZI|nr:hypothetical protein NUW58_g7662 [Xylaria curta]